MQKFSAKLHFFLRICKKYLNFAQILIHNYQNQNNHLY